MRGLEETSEFTCKLCSLTMGGREPLIQHLRDEHEPLEVVSFAAVTMIDEQSRDASALEFNHRFEKLRKIITG